MTLIYHTIPYHISPTGLVEGLVGNNAHSAAVHARKPNNDVLRVVGLQLKEVVLVDDLQQLCE